MAKKRKRLDERKEEREYKPPEFDRLEYVKTETVVSKATIIAALFSLPVGFVAMYIMPVGGFGSGLLVGIAGMGMVWFILPRLKVDVIPFKLTHWAGVLSTYFLVFLAVWVILCNPPFNDLASPEIVSVRVSWGWGEAIVNTSEMGSQEVFIPSNVTHVTVHAQITDNTKVDSNSVFITRGEHSIPMSQDSNDETIFESDWSVSRLDTFTIAAMDVKGNEHRGYTFTVDYEVPTANPQT